MQITQRTTRNIALLAGGVLAVSSLHPTPARADKSSAYKAGAIGLGVAAGALLLKGKTLPGILAGAGAYYAYKKSQDAKRHQNYRYGQRADNNYNRYPTDNGGYGNGGYNNGSYNNGSYNNGSYNNGGYGRDADTDYSYNGANRNGDDCKRDNCKRDGSYRSAENYPTYNDPANYPDSQTYRQDQDDVSDVRDYNHVSRRRDNGNEPDYGYRALSQGHRAHAARRTR